jgi:hypothetical protein
MTTTLEHRSLDAPLLLPERPAPHRTAQPPAAPRLVGALLLMQITARC